MGLEEVIINRWINSHTTEEKLELVRKLMPNILESMGKEDLIALASQIVPEMTKRCWECMTKDDLIETSHTMIIQIMENSLSQLPLENRKAMLDFFRETLRKMEQKFLTSDKNL